MCKHKGFCVQEAACGRLREEQPRSAGVVLSVLGPAGSTEHEPVVAVQKEPQALAEGFSNAGLALGRRPVLRRAMEPGHTEAAPGLLRRDRYKWFSRRWWEQGSEGTGIHNPIYLRPPNLPEALYRCPTP